MVDRAHVYHPSRACKPSPRCTEYTFPCVHALYPSITRAPNFVLPHSTQQTRVHRPYAGGLVLPPRQKNLPFTSTYILNVPGAHVHRHRAHLHTPPRPPKPTPRKHVYQAWFSRILSIARTYIIPITHALLAFPPRVHRTHQ